MRGIGIDLDTLPEFEFEVENACKWRVSDGPGSGGSAFEFKPHHFIRAEANCLTWDRDEANVLECADWGGVEWDSGDPIGVCSNCGKMALPPPSRNAATGTKAPVDSTDDKRNAQPLDLDQVHRLAPWVFDTSVGLELLGQSADQAANAVAERPATGN